MVDFRVESQLNHFTTFEILIPVTHDESPGKGSDDQQLDALPFLEAVKAKEAFNETILLVEDDAAVGKHMEHVLKQLGYSVQSKSTAREALQLIREGTTDFRLMITDYSMPQMTGLELAKQIHEHLPSLPVILMSGFLNEEAFRSLPASLEPVFIQKPFTIQDLATSITKAIRRTDSAHQSTRRTAKAKNGVFS